MSDCIFCNLPETRVLGRHGTALAIRDAFPVTEGHTLVIPLRHAATLFDLTAAETSDALGLVRELAAELRASDPSISGFNVGANAGEAAGQTVMHCHIHLIPRRDGDVANPRGGVRWVIPEKADYKA